jgi:hypothetical protein
MSLDAWLTIGILILTFSASAWRLWSAAWPAFPIPVC